MDAVVQFGKSAVKIPSERETAVFIFLKALKLLDKVKLKLDGDPGSELEGDILMGICAAVTARRGCNSFRPGAFDPLFGGSG
jgi:hypothetical protein